LEKLDFPNSRGEVFISMNILITESQVDKLMDEELWANIEKGEGSAFDWDPGDVKNSKKFLIPLSMMIPNQTVDGIEGNPMDMTTDEDKQRVSNIIKRIKNGKGVSPILVHKVKDGFLIVDGHHRVEALKQMGKKYGLSVIIPKKNVKFVKSHMDYVK